MPKPLFSFSSLPDIDSVNLLRDSASRYLAGSYVERSFALEPSVSYTGGTEPRLHGR